MGCQRSPWHTGNFGPKMCKDSSQAPHCCLWKYFYYILAVKSKNFKKFAGACASLSLYAQRMQTQYKWAEWFKDQNGLYEILLGAMHSQLPKNFLTVCKVNNHVVIPGLKNGTFLIHYWLVWLRGEKTRAKASKMMVFYLHLSSLTLIEMPLWLFWLWQFGGCCCCHAAATSLSSWVYFHFQGLPFQTISKREVLNYYTKQQRS